MKVFNQINPWPNKVNFVDDNNVVLGYDIRQCCCENAGWFISSQIHNSVPDDYSEYQQEIGYDDYNFDIDFYQEERGGCEEGKIAIFKIYNLYTKEAAYVHLFNQHNGYYGHGFNFCVPKREGVL